MSDRLVRRLRTGPLDIVGDVHGEIEALQSLLGHLGYARDGTHREGRHLVFVGDLTDRGPDSPAVVDWVARLCAVGRAQAVLGNHDLNLLLDRHKTENRWFYGQELRNFSGRVVPQALADKEIRKRVLSFFYGVPLVLVREDLRVVHACWDGRMVDLVAEEKNVILLFQQHMNRIEEEVRDCHDLDGIDQDLVLQNENPVTRLTSGPEERSEQAQFKGGKWRHEQRVPWWEAYRDPVYCVFGHYALPAGARRTGGAALCIDFGVGKRSTERNQVNPTAYQWRLAAARFPERYLVLDNGIELPWPEVDSP